MFECRSRSSGGRSRHGSEAGDDEVGSLNWRGRAVGRGESSSTGGKPGKEGMRESQ